jgi:FAD/FMN-containing dehydrogenase
MIQKLKAMTIDNAIIEIDANKLQVFRSGFGGNLTLPEDDGYANARLVWNGMIDRQPAMIAHCLDEQDVVLAVNFAREHRLLTAVRGGTHNVAGLATCDAGLVIDLSAINNVEVDLERNVAVVGGGARWGDVDPVTQAHGLATPGGVVSDTGVAGLTLGGGFGHLRNKYGLTCDNLVAAELVTADGQLIRASETENRDLLWGLRGGGGNFGVVTRFEFQLHPLGPEVFFCLVFHPGQDIAKALKFFRDYTQNSPDEVSALASIGIFPEGAEGFPPEVYEQPFVAFIALYAGDPATGERTLAQLREYSTPVVDYSAVMLYETAQAFFDEDYPAHDMRYYWKSSNLMTLDDHAINIIADNAVKQPSAFSTTDIWHNGGAIKRYTQDHAAFYGRQASYLLNVEANWVDPQDDQANIAWARGFLDQMKPFSDGSLYLNFAGLQEEGQAMMRGAYGPHYARLAELKAKYDPDNLFRLNQNINPKS